MITDIIAVLIALLSLVVVFFQLRIYTKTMNADFIFRLRNDFYSKKNKFIMFFIENDFIEFKENKEKGKEYESYFEINRVKVEKLQEQFSAFKKYAKETEYAIHIQDMDNYVLGYLEDIGEFNKRKVVDFTYILISFGYSILKVYENKAIIDYIKWVRASEDKICRNDYMLFEDIAKEIIKKNI